MFASDSSWLLSILPDVLDQCKLSRRSKLKHLMFLEFTRLRDLVWKTNFEWNRLSSILSDLQLSEFANLYGQLCKLELRSLGRGGKSQDTMTFLHTQVFPIMARSIPSVFLKAISERAFDSELYEDEIDKFRTCGLNTGIPGEWWSNNPFKSWNDSVSRKPSKGTEENNEFSGESLAVVYEAPWVMPSLAKPEPKAKNDLKRMPVNIPARSLKMEGRRQSYVPDETDDGGCDALCVVPERVNDGFSISRGILDAMREWSQEDTHSAPMMIHDQPLGDVLQDLLQSPPQPSTRVASPVKESVPSEEPDSPRTVKRVRRNENNDDSENVPPKNRQVELLSNTAALLAFNVESEVSTALPSAKVTPARKLRPTLSAPDKMKTCEQPKSEREKRRMSRGEDDYFELNAL